MVGWFYEFHAAVWPTLHVAQRTPPEADSQAPPLTLPFVFTDTEQEDLQYNLFKRQHNAGVMKQSEVAKNFGKQAANRLSQLSEVRERLRLQ